MRIAERPTKQTLARDLRSAVASHVFDESGGAPDGTAIYTLSDPRDLRAPRYVGQTTAPRRRLLQHWNTARLWLPDETPWWVKAPEHRPLYEWIRALHEDERRLPVMIVAQWVSTHARAAERMLIRQCLAKRLSLLNVEAAVFGPQIPLL